MVNNTITQNFGVGADSLEESDILTEDAELEREDEDAAVIRLLTKLSKKPLTTAPLTFILNPARRTQIRYRIDGELVPVRVPDNLIKFKGAIIA